MESPPAVQETRVPSLGWEDPPEKEVATHSSILAWRIPWTEEPGRPPFSMGLQKSHTWLSDLTTTVCVCVNSKLLIYPSPTFPFGNLSLFSMSVSLFCK